jgi:Putative MetA-pathway of phenol degradation
MAGPARSQQFAYNGSIQYAAGDYLFTQRTDSIYVLNGFDISAGPLGVQVSVPVIMQNTPWVSYGPTPIPSGGTESGEVARQIRQRGQTGGSGGGAGGAVQLPTDALSYEAGLGDPILSWTLAVPETGIRDVELRLTGGVKVPLAQPADGFATGEWDYSGGVAVTAQASARDSLFGDVSYWVFGDMPDLAFRNALAYGFAYGRILRPERWSTLVSLNGMTRTLENAEAPIQLGFGLTRSFGIGRSLSFNLGVGLSETVPGLSAGLGWRMGL